MRVWPGRPGRARASSVSPVSTGGVSDTMLSPNSLAASSGLSAGDLHQRPCRSLACSEATASLRSACCHKGEQQRLVEADACSERHPSGAAVPMIAFELGPSDQSAAGPAGARWPGSGSLHGIDAGRTRSSSISWPWAVQAGAARRRGWGASDRGPRSEPNTGFARSGVSTDPGRGGCGLRWRAPADQSDAGPHQSGPDPVVGQALPGPAGRWWRRAPARGRSARLPAPQPRLPRCTRRRMPAWAPRPRDCCGSTAATAPHWHGARRQPMAAARPRASKPAGNHGESQTCVRWRFEDEGSIDAWGDCKEASRSGLIVNEDANGVDLG